jgi:hypothetical protein
MLSVVFVDFSPPGKQVPKEFKHSRLVDDFWSEHRGRATTHFHIYFLWNS